jgi:hypothetical protein
VFSSAREAQTKRGSERLRELFHACFEVGAEKRKGVIVVECIHSKKKEDLSTLLIERIREAKREGLY